MEELKVRARRLPEELLTQGDLALADELVTPTCVHHAPTLLVPGAAGMKQWARALRRAFPDLSAVVEDEIAEGDTVAQRLTLSGTHEGAFLGVPPTGQRATWPVVVIQRVDLNGQVADHWAIWDQLGLLQQLGAPPTGAGACTESIG